MLNKLHLFLFSLTLSKSIVFWRFFAHRYWSKFATKLQQHCAPLLTTVLSLAWETKVRNISQFAHDSSNASFKSHDSYAETHHSKCSKCLPLALKHALKQSHHWSITLSTKLCWLLTIFQSDAISAHWRPSLISDKLVPAYRFQLASPGFRILCGFHAARGKSEWCILLWCLAAQTVAAKLLVKLLVTYFPVHHACTRAPSCCDTRLWTSQSLYMRPPTDHTSIL